MAIYHATCKPISRGNGHSVTAKAAYIGCKKITDSRTGNKFDYTRKKGFLGGGIVLPDDINLDIDSSELWNRAEESEKRKDARVGREWEISLPHELNEEQRSLLAKAITMEIANRYKVACEYALHAPSKEGDQRNFHVHIVSTTRKINQDGTLGDKSDIELENKAAVKRGIPTTKQQITDMREVIANITNQHLSLAGIEERVSHLSYLDQGIDKVAGIHKGKAVTEMERRGLSTDVGDLHDAAEKINQEIVVLKNQVFSDGAELSELQKEIQKAANSAEYNTNNGEITNILSKGNIVKILKTIEYHDSVFTRDTINRLLSKSFKKYDLLNKSIDEILADKNVVNLGYGDDGRERFTTASMLAVERDIQANIIKLKEKVFSNINDKTIDSVLSDYKLLTGKQLTLEQNNAVRHIIGNSRISCIVGRAGTGKSFSLAAAKNIWDSNGNTVYGIAVSGIAADGLAKDANIDSRTIASFLLAVNHGAIKLNNSSVIVMDEAGMTDSLSMQKVIAIAEKSGAKLVLVGDPAQLQPVGPGASFRAILEKTGFAEIQNVYRQKEEWQRQATVDFSQANTAEAIQSYYDNGCIKLVDNSILAMEQLVKDWQNQREQTKKDISKFLVVAHRNIDVQILNKTLRNLRVTNNEISEGYTVNNVVSGKERETKIAQNDRIIFLRNDKKLCVANGRFATITYVNFSESGKVIDFNVKVDGHEEEITIDPKTYNNFDYGYAATVHKTQGVTVDHSFVYGGGNLNSSLTYVAMTRHRESTGLYASTEQYADIEALKGRVSRLDAKDSVLNYLDELDDYASRRGIDANQGTFKQVIIDSLRKAKERLVEIFSGQKKRLDDLGVIEEVTPEPIYDTKEYAKAVADYVQATKDFAMADAEFKPKLAELGLERVSFKAEHYSVISQMPEYQERMKIFDRRIELAYKVVSDLEKSALAIKLNNVDIDKLTKNAAHYENKLRVENYVAALKENSPERFKLAYAIRKDIAAHYAKLTANQIEIKSIDKDSNTYLFNHIKNEGKHLRFLSFESAVKGFLELNIEVLQGTYIRDSLPDNDITGRMEIQRTIDAAMAESKEYAIKFEKMYGDELAKHGGFDKNITISKLGGAGEILRRCLDKQLTVNDYSAISRGVAVFELAAYNSAKTAWINSYNEHLPLMEKYKAEGVDFKKTAAFTDYLKYKIAYGEEAAKIVGNFKDFERACSVLDIKFESLERTASFVEYDKALQMGLEYLDLKDKNGRKAYELSYGLSTCYSVTQKLGIDAKEINARAKELVEAYVVQKNGVEPLSSILPGSEYTDIVSNSKVSMQSSEEQELQKSVIEYLENNILIPKLFTEKMLAQLKNQSEVLRTGHNSDYGNIHCS